MKTIESKKITYQISFLLLCILTLSACNNGQCNNRECTVTPDPPSIPTLPLEPLNPALRPINPPLLPILPTLEPITSPHIIWAQQVGESGGFTYGSGVRLDRGNNIYIAGSTNIDINGHPHNNDSYYFVTKANSQGKILWDDGAQSGYSMANGLAVTPDGNLYVTGYTSTSIFDQKMHGLNDYFIVKYH